ncbi:MAG TPA: DUF421 domain-containing protein [Bacillota bacterium]|nr:DUF421 domain-containing protein [Clostridiales bacterium]HOQ14790.1 DUF421 domain-containing protein [Bacillota bacterium]HPU17230.1 DUF421 domain-containing protein [Bacillota bacterium]
MATVLIRALIIYILFGVSMRLMGKRQIGEFRISELVTTLILSEIAAIPITEINIPLLYAIAPIIMILTLEIVLSYAETKWNVLKRAISGKPSILIARGVVNQRELMRLRIGISELVAQVRQSGVGDIADVNYAILEDDGRLTVLPKVEKRPPSTEELRDVLANTKPSDAGVAHVLIIDGKIIKENLKLAGKDENYIMKKLDEQGYTLSEVLLFTCNDTGDVNIIKKENVGGGRKRK